MSSDDEIYFDGSDDDDAFFGPDDDDSPRQPQAPQAAPAPRRTTRSTAGQASTSSSRAAGPPPPIGNTFGDLFQQAQHHFMNQNMHPGAFQAGFGGHAFARPPPSAFRRQYRAYSTAILEVQQGRSYGGGRSNLMYGGKIVMPPSALNELTQLDIDAPWTFEIANPAHPELNTHVGVLEFIADEGTVNLPQWVMDQLRLNEGDPIRIWGGRYPKGKMIKIQPQSSDFLEISDPKAVLEQALRNFSCLSAGDIVEIGYHKLTFRLLIMEITPPGPAISVLDTDLEVDFAPPLGYVEPDYKKLSEPAPTMKEKFVIDTKGTQDVDARGSGANTPVPGKRSGSGTPTTTAPWEAFKGSGNSLAGKRIKGKGVSARKIEAVDVDSRIIRTDQPRIITADTQVGNRQVPAALNLPFGNLFFGFENIRPPPGSAADLAERERNDASTAPPAPFAGVSGSGNTLSGRARNLASAPSGANGPGASPRAPRASSADTKPNMPFSGYGKSLNGATKKGNVDVIEIDSD